MKYFLNWKPWIFSLILVLMFSFPTWAEESDLSPDAPEIPTETKEIQYEGASLYQKKLLIKTEFDNDSFSLLESQDGVHYIEKAYDKKVELGEASFWYQYSGFLEESLGIRFVSHPDTVISDLTTVRCEVFCDEFDSVENTEHFSVGRFDEYMSSDFGQSYLKKISLEEAELSYPVLGNHRLSLEIYSGDREVLSFFYTDEDNADFEVFPEIIEKDGWVEYSFSALPETTQYFKIRFSQTDAIENYPYLGAFRVFEGLQIVPEFASKILIPLPEDKMVKKIPLSAKIYDTYEDNKTQAEFLWEFTEVPGVRMYENQLYISDSVLPGDITIRATSVDFPLLEQTFTLTLQPRTAVFLSEIEGPSVVTAPQNGGNFVYEYTVEALDEEGNPLPASVVSWELSEEIAGIHISGNKLSVSQSVPSVTLIAKVGELWTSKTITTNPTQLFSFSVSSNEIEHLDSFFVTLSTNLPIDNLYAMQAELQFSESDLTFLSMESCVSGYTLTPVVAPGRCVFGFTRQTLTGEAVSGNLMKFRFQLLKNQNTSLVLKNFILLDDSLLQKEFYDLNLPQEIKVFVPAPIIVPSGGGGGGGFGGGGGGATSVPSGTVGATQIPVLPPAVSEQPQENSAFSDLEDASWAEEAILALAEKGIVNGAGDKLFLPQQEVTRAEFIKMLILGFSELEENPTCDFGDVSTTDWFYPYIATAARKGVLTGYLGMAHPNQAITREEMFVMLYRMLGYTADVKQDVIFEDETEISEWAKEAIFTLGIRKIVNGDENHKVNPKKHASRAEAAQLLFNCLGKESVS